MFKRKTSKTRKVKKAKRNVITHVLKEMKANLFEGSRTVAQVSVSIIKEIGPIGKSIGQAAKDGFCLGLETVQGSAQGAVSGANGSFKRVQRRIKRRKNR